MPDDPAVIASSRLARWIALLLLVAGGVVLYFRTGTRVPPFGSAGGETPAAGAAR